MLRRRRLPDDVRPAYQAFRDGVAHVERANAFVARTIPTTRLPGVPLAEALLGFEEELVQARAALARSSPPAQVEERWRGCEDAVAAALSIAERLRLEAEQPEGFEALVGTIGDLTVPLEDAFGAAEEAFRRARR
jgi:hypothetical protein